MATILSPKHIGTQKQIFLDNEIIEDMSGIRRTYPSVAKHPANPLLRGQYPWEDGGVRLFGTVLFEDGRFRMWYEGHINQPRQTFVCYATSTDGLNWERPSLGIAELAGSARNNIVTLGDGLASGPTVVRDDADPELVRRYKLVYIGRAGVALACSPDGLHWTPSPANPLHRGHNDTHLVLTKALTGDKWLLCARPETYAGHWKRRVAMSESADLVNWTEFSNVLIPDELDPPEFYYMVPFVYEGLYIGLVAPYRNATSSSMDVQIASSRDGWHWQRPVRRETFIPLGNIGQFDSHIIWMSSAPLRVGDELWFYYCGFQGRHDWAPHQAAVGLATLRLDGFVCLDATDPVTIGEAVAAAKVDLGATGGHTTEKVIWPDDGVMVTRPFIWEGKHLAINAWAPAGAVAVEVIDAATRPSDSLPGPSHGTAYDGLDLAACDAFSGDSVHYTMSWQGRTDLDHLQGKPVRLKFVLRGARLFAFQPTAN